MLFRKKDEGAWQSISDLMTGLMVVFLFISLGLICDVQNTRSEYVQTKQKIYNSLNEEFKPEELAKWGTHINPDTLTVSFSEPSVYFGENSSDVNDHFKTVLNDFFPRYVRVLQQYSDEIVEVRIEGNASKDFMGDPNSPSAYFYNMNLSQQRAFNVLTYVYSIPSSENFRPWLRDKLRANGASYSNAVSDASASRCVTISIHRNAESVLESLNEGKS